MLLVADSGSTKTNWLLTDHKNFKTEIETIGFNPFFHSTEFILNELKKNPSLVKYANEIRD
ncbi:MAG TPA: ATPase, partial [Bacteroidia bacterium]|nr:ATPase [Bacteroidia bacterium]